jgi:hypothetical protein
MWRRWLYRFGGYYELNLQPVRENNVIDFPADQEYELKPLPLETNELSYDYRMLARALRAPRQRLRPL